MPSTSPRTALSPRTPWRPRAGVGLRTGPAELREQVAARLVGLVRAAGTHLGTGFLATPYLLPVLAETGHLDVAYELLLQRTAPSWITMLERDATTVWESWEGVDERGQVHDSLNHYSKGAVISFLHRHVAGIQLVEGCPASRRFRVAPAPGGGLTWADAVHDSPIGRIESSWRLDGDDFELTVTVPRGPRQRSHFRAPTSWTCKGQGRLGTPADCVRRPDWPGCSCSLPVVSVSSFGRLPSPSQDGSQDEISQFVNRRVLRRNRIHELDAERRPGDEVGQE